MAGLGTHDELLATSATYREIVESQLGVEARAPWTPSPKKNAQSSSSPSRRG